MKLTAIDVTPEGLLAKGPLPWKKPHVVFYDDVMRVDGGLAFTRQDELIVLGAHQAALACARTAPLEPVLSRAVSAWTVWQSGPHAPLVAARGLVDQARALGASDIHVEPSTDRSMVRMRICGELVDVVAFDGPNALRLMAALKAIAACVPYQREVVQEGRIASTGASGDVRASFVPTVFGERAALRLFGKLLSLNELGLSSQTYTAMASMLEGTRGLFLVSGETGAGKTTTLYAALAHVAAKRPGAHLSLEDPVEQRLRHGGIPVDQIELDPARGITASAMLVAALRQDVDVLCVGEIRTADEATFALQAAHTGRLVLAGLHAGSASEARQRLLDLGADPTVLRNTLQGIVHQSLVTEACGCTEGCARCNGGRVRRLRASLWTPARPLQEAA